VPKVFYKVFGSYKFQDEKIYARLHKSLRPFMGHFRTRMAISFKEVDICLNKKAAAQLVAEASAMAYTA
jgi:hypothetical protein